MTRKYFLKGLRAKAIVRPPKPTPVCPPDHKRKVVMAVRLRSTGTSEHMAMSSRKAARVLGGQKGGLKSASLGTAHRWTSESARKAAIKSWTKRRKFNKLIGARVGVRANRRPKLWREPLRAYYAENPTRGIQWTPPILGYPKGYWTRQSHLLSERAALTALGHLRSSRGYIPDTVMTVNRRPSKGQK